MPETPPVEPEAVRILVVEDEGVVAMDLQSTLERLGYKVVGQTSKGEDALALASERHPDVILMDIRLAGAMDGIEAARLVRETLGLPVVFLTAHADRATLEKARTAEPYAYIVKPFDDVSIRTNIEVVQYKRLAEQERARANQAEALAIRAENRRLKDLDDLRSRFVGMAAHELNTPLTPLLINVQLLATTLKGDLTPAQESALALVQRNLQRLASLVRDLLEATRMESGHLKISPERMDLRQVVEAATETFRERAARSGVALEVRAPKGVPAVADAQRIGQILVNLLDNAFKYTPAGGRIAVELAKRAGAPVITVADTGAGLDAGQISRLFKPFSMVHQAEGAPPGTGLGLYISQGIARAHGGELSCASEGPGKGTTFTLTLPAKEARAPRPQRPARAPLPGSDGGSKLRATAAPEPSP